MLEVRNSEAAHLAATTKGLIQRTVSPPPPKYLALLSRALWRQTMASVGVGTRCLLSPFLKSSEFEICGYYGGEYVVVGLVGCEVMWACIQILMFRANILPPIFRPEI
jgi:hypothetical protein